MDSPEAQHILGVGRMINQSTIDTCFLQEVFPQSCRPFSPVLHVRFPHNCICFPAEKRPGKQNDCRHVLLAVLFKKDVGRFSLENATRSCSEILDRLLGHSDRTVKLVDARFTQAVVFSREEEKVTVMH